MVPHGGDVGEVLRALDAESDQGLSEAEAARRLARHGRNELLRAPPPPAWRKFLAQFQDVLVLLLVGAAGISTALWIYERDTALPFEALVILAIVLLNAVMGYVQTARAERAVAALRGMAASRATVIRDGARRRIAAAEIVPGDRIVVEEGDVIPADARLVHATALETSEAALTGESLPVTKEPGPGRGDEALAERRNMIFSGTTATYGRGIGVVVATGMETEVGRIAGLLSETPEEVTPLKRQLDRTGRMLGAAVVVLAAVMVAVLLVAQPGRGWIGAADVLVLGIALAVAAVPEGLPAVVTAVLSIGVQRMARRNAIVTHLAAVETLGSATVVASDKTGTLTRNEMTVRVASTSGGRVWFDGAGYEPVGAFALEDGRSPPPELREEMLALLLAGAAANNSELSRRDGRWTVVGDPTEGAILCAAGKAGIDLEEFREKAPRCGEIPFSSERKRMSTIHSDAGGGGLTLYAKGAPDVLLTRCTAERRGTEDVPLTEARRAEILREAEALAEQALRTLGAAARRLLDGETPVRTDLERDLVFLGIVGMIDPPRAEARSAVDRARRAGIRPVMITGDHPRTAAVIAAQLGIGDGGAAVTGAELERLSDGELREVARSAPVYARVNPEHKLKIVRALQADGQVVAMTGDGVNDAPALKAADIGIAMGITGTDVSRETADMVLADDDFATIVAAVEEGRTIFANIRKFLRFLLSSNIGEVLAMFLGVLFAGTLGLRGADGEILLPLLAVHILWINLVTDGAPALALGLEPVGRGVMNRPPRPPGEPVITGPMWAANLGTGLVMALSALLVLDASLPGGLIAGTGEPAYGRTMAFTTLVLAQLLNTLNARASSDESAFARLFRNRWLRAAVGLSLLLQIAVVHLPFLRSAFSTVSLRPADWAVCAAAASAVVWSRELGLLAVRAARGGGRRHEGGSISGSRAAR